MCIIEPFQFPCLLCEFYEVKEIRIKKIEDKEVLCIISKRVVYFHKCINVYYIIISG